MRVWSSSNVTESFPGATTALTYSFARYFYRVIFYDCYRRLGVDPRSLHDHFEQLDRMIGFLGGHVFYSLNTFYQLHSQSPLFPIMRKHSEKMMGLRQSYETRPGGFWSQALDNAKKGVEAAAAAVIVLDRLRTHRRDMQEFTSGGKASSDHSGASRSSGRNRWPWWGNS